MKRVRIGLAARNAALGSGYRCAAVERRLDGGGEVTFVNEQAPGDVARLRVRVEAPR